mmetsp:Transcript_84580/g.192787  ORF Transcript_84580/g.192787 Transcript_84580/m.192787 type:complete len:516 (-) Transcript_84580:111-1658(-)
MAEGKPGLTEETPLAPGHRVYAVWAGNGRWYPGVVENVSADGDQVTVSWDDQGTDHKTMKTTLVQHYTLFAGEEAPWTKARIDAAVEVKAMDGKGRCLFTRDRKSPGGLIFVEKPICAALPSKHPQLWQAITAINEQHPLDLGPGWHFAAAVSILDMDEEATRLALDKWAPEEEFEPCQDSLLVLDHLNKRHMAGLDKVDANLYQRLLVSWRYNAFAHGSETNGLVMYNRISMMAHSCSATCCWQYGPGDTFVLRSRVHLEAGSELTVSYLEEEDLAKGTDIRRRKLSMWRFTCGCERCNIPLDTSRGFNCPKCAAGSCFVKVDSFAAAVAPASTQATPQLQPCTVCYAPVGKTEQKELLEYESQYVDVLEGMSKTDIPRIEEVRACALQCFRQHWVLNQLEQWLLDCYKNQQGFAMECVILSQRILQYLNATCPLVSHSLGWAYESVGDMLVESSLGPNSAPAGLRRERFREAATQYEHGYRALAIIVGEDGDSARVIRQKWTDALSEASGAAK